MALRRKSRINKYGEDERMSGARALNMPLGIVCQVYGVVLHQRGMCRNVREEEFSKGLGFSCC